MSAGDYYGSGNQGYGGYRQQPYPPQQQEQRRYGGGEYDAPAPSASYGESLEQNRQRVSPYSQPGSGQYDQRTSPQPGYGRPPPGNEYGGQGGYSQQYQSYGGQQQYQPQQGYGGGAGGYGPRREGQQGYGQGGYGQGGYGQGGYGQGGQGGYGEQGNYSNYPPPQGPPHGQLENRPGEGQEGDRGFLGAVAGGAAGGFGGHKLGHGVIGTIGGAVAGSMLEDHVKKERKEKKEHEQQQHQMQMQQQQQHYNRPGPPPPHHGNFEGNFSASSGQITMDRDYDLIASCGGMDGRSHMTSINLNSCLGNSWGNFKWERDGNFGGSARNVRLVDNGRVLEAELGDGNGGWNRAHVFLDEKITNENGELKFLG